MPHGERYGAGVVEARPDLIEEHAQEARVDGQVLVVEPEVEEVGDEGRGELCVDALEQAGEARIAREALHELLVVEDLVADLPELVRGQVQELIALELLGVDAVGDALELDGRGAQLLHEAGGVGLGALEGARLHHHDDVLELAEVLGVLDVALHVRRALGEHVAPGRLERERVQRVGDARHGEEHGQQHRQDRARTRHPNQLTEQAAGSRDGDHDVGCRERKKCNTGIRAARANAGRATRCAAAERPA